jgi:hypothetical protein
MDLHEVGGENKQEKGLVRKDKEGRKQNEHRIPECSPENLIVLLQSQ